MHSYINVASVGLKGCIFRCNDIVDDFGNSINILCLGPATVWNRLYFLYFTNYITGIDKDNIHFYD